MTVLSVISGAVLTSVLFYSGLAKLVVPVVLSDALGEFFGSRRPSVHLVRLVAVTEVVASLLVALREESFLTHVLVAALGLGFVSLGLAGHFRGTTRPCGCFGGSNTKSFGLWNAVVGVALIAWAGLPPMHQHANAAATLLLGMSFATTIPIVANRRYVTGLVGTSVKQRRSRS